MIVTRKFGVEALLDDVAGELELAQSDEVLGNLLENSLVFLPVLELDHVLHQIVTVWVLNKLVDVVDDEVGKFKLLCPGSLLEASLHDATAMFVLSDWHAVVNASLENEVGVLAGLVAAEVVLILGSFRRLEDHEQGLDDVVSVHVNGQVDDLHVQAGNDLSEDLVIKQMHGCELETLHLLERSLFVLCPFDVLDLTLDSIENAPRKPLNQNLDHSCSVDIE